MMLLDANVMIYAHRRDVPRHQEYREWLQQLVDGPQPYAVSDLALAGMVRVVTNPRIFRQPATIAEALDFADMIRHQPHARLVSPGPGFWQIFSTLCRQAQVRGDLVPDTYLAALAVEHGCEVISDDKDFDKFPGLRWSRPLF